MGEDRGGGGWKPRRLGVGGVRGAGEERMGGLAGEINKDLYHLILGVATDTCSTILTCNHCVKFKLHSLFLKDSLEIFPAKSKLVKSSVNKLHSPR